MPRKRIWFSIAALVVAALVIAFILMIQVPKPQIASVEGKPAPDFTLKDQDGNSFQLASLRGSRVLFIFYRGYW